MAGVGLNLDALEPLKRASESLEVSKDNAMRIKELATDIAQQSGIPKLIQSTEALCDACDNMFGKSHVELKEATEATRDFYQRISDNF